MSPTATADRTSGAPSRQGSGSRGLAGRDAELPRWMRAGLEPVGDPKWDSVVVVGNGVGALTLTARLARSPAFAGRVTIAAPPIDDGRRLVEGVTLRARALDYQAHALGISHERLVEALYGDDAERVETRSQRAALFRPGSTSRFEPGRIGVWMRSEHHRDRVLAYGVRTTHLTATLHREMAGLDFHWTTRTPTSIDGARALAVGDRPLVVNAAPKPLGGTGGAPKPDRFVVASQLAFTAPRRGERGIVPDHSSLVAAIRRPGRLDLGAFYPLADPRSPTAEFCGIVFGIVRTGPGFDRDATLAILRETVVGVGEALGLEPLDESETLGQAMVPCTPWRDVHPGPEGVVDLARITGAGAPILTGDEGVRAAIGGVVTAECVLAGIEPGPAVNRALHRWRATNRVLALAMTTLAPVTTAGLALAPGGTLGAIQNQGDLWASLE